MTTTTISVRVSPAVADRLQRLADAMARSKSYLAAQAIEEFLALQEWQVEAILEGVAEADAGVGVDYREVRSRWEARVADPPDRSG